MNRVYGIILACLFPCAAFAEPGNDSVSGKLAAFKGAKVKLESDIDAFLDQVNACNPAHFKTEIVDGFGNTTKASSAKSLLNFHEKMVSDHVAAAESQIAAAKQSACSSQAALEASVGSTVQKNLGDDLGDYRRGVSEANKKKFLIVGILSRGKNSGACQSAIKQLDVMDASNNDLQAKLVDLQTSYAERIALEQGHVTAGSACGSAKAASQDEPANVETADAGNSASAL